MRVTPEGTLDQIDVTSETNTETDGYDVSLSQTLFDLSAWFGWKAGKETSRQAEANLLRRNRISSSGWCSPTLACCAQDNLRHRKPKSAPLSATEQTRQRFEVGLIAITDVYEAEAARDLAQVTRIVDENNVAVAKENLSVLTGQTPGALFVLGETFDPKQACRARSVNRLCHVQQLPASRISIRRGGGPTDCNIPPAWVTLRLHGDVSLSGYRDNGQHQTKPESLSTFHPIQSRPMRAGRFALTYPCPPGAQSAPAAGVPRNVQCRSGNSHQPDAHHCDAGTVSAYDGNVGVSRVMRASSRLCPARRSMRHRRVMKWALATSLTS